METKLVKIDSLITENLQTRAAMHPENINDYAQEYLNPDNKMPPVTVFYDSMLDRYYLADGFHRVAACKQNGSDTILANVTEGTYDDALKFAVSANADNNSIYRSNADKRHALEIAWANWRLLLGKEPPKGKTDNKPNGLPSCEQLATLCCVNPETVRLFMRKQADPIFGSTPESSDTDNGRARAPREPHAPDAIAVTREHLEERNPAVRALLKEGKDRFGLTIPERILEVFHSRVPMAFIRDLSTIRKALEDRRLKGDVACARFVATAMEDVDRTIRHIKDGLAYCVCPPCRGEGKIGSGKACACCGGLGFQTKRQYKMNREYNESHQ